MPMRPSPDAGPARFAFNASEQGIISTWLVGSFLPTWGRILTRPGYVAFPEEVDRRGMAIDSPERSTMVTARLIYTLCLCHELDPAGPYLDAARHGYCRGARELTANFHTGFTPMAGGQDNLQTCTTVHSF
jgi:mannose/cellobiose epimerase-like protein (N-acyl-D-glucosamine 2-epimerase family)